MRSCWGRLRVPWTRCNSPISCGIVGISSRPRMRLNAMSIRGRCSGSTEIWKGLQPSAKLRYRPTNAEEALNDATLTWSAMVRAALVICLAGPSLHGPAPNREGR